MDKEVSVTTDGDPGMVGIGKVGAIAQMKEP